MVAKTNEFKMSKYKVERAHFKQLLAKHFPVKVIQSIIIKVNTRRQKTIEFVKENKNINKYKWNYCHHFQILPLLGVNHHLPLLYMSKNFVYIHKT